MQPYVFGIMGVSGQDRAILMERLIPELTRRGHRIGTIVEDPTEMVTAGTARYRRAGAVSSVIAGPGPMEPDRLIALLGDVTLVLAEGFANQQWPKLEVHGGSGSLAFQKDPWLVAVAGPAQPRACPTPWYHWDEIPQIANVIENASSLGLAIK